MTLLDEKLTPKILALIDRFGVPAEVELWTDPAYNAETGENAPSATPTYDVTVVPLQALEELPEGEDGASKKIGAKTYLKGTVAFTPNTTMRLTINSQTWQVFEVKTYRPGTTIAAYGLKLERGV